MKRSASERRISVLLVEDHMVVREGLRALLEAKGDIQVVAEAATGRQAVELTKKLRPAVVVMDISMPRLNGLEATRQILKAVPGTRVIILSAHGEDAYIEQVATLGAAGYLIKQTSAHELARAVREVQKGHTFFSPAIARRLRKPSEPFPKPGGRTPLKGVTLSPREVEVLQLIAEGLANKQIAGELGVSVKTIEKHRQRVMGKLNIHDTAGLTRHAISEGIIECGVARPPT